MNFKNYIPILALLVFVTTFIVFTTTTINFVSGSLSDLPSKVSITLLTTDCEICEDVSTAKTAVLSQNVKLTNEKEISAMTSEGKSLATKYGITRFPAVIVTGNLKSLSIQSYQSVGNALVYQTLNVPYTDVEGTTKGIVKITTINADDCAPCMGVTGALNFLLENGVYLEEELTQDYTESSDLISKYEIENVPALILSEDLKEYGELYDVMLSLSTINEDASLVYESQAPFYNLESQTVKGLVNLVYLSDATCADCYNVSIHQVALPGIGLFNQNEEIFLDISDPEGAALVEKYNISKVPTVIVSGEHALYDSFVAYWAQYELGSVESDGAYVFTNMEALGGAVFSEI